MCWNWEFVRGNVEDIFRGKGWVASKVPVGTGCRSSWVGGDDEVLGSDDDELERGSEYFVLDEMVLTIP